MAAKQAKVERGTPASHSSVTATVKASSGLGQAALSTGSTGKAAAADTGWTLSCMGFRAYGEGFTRSLGLSKAPLSLCGVFFLVYNLDLLVKR